MLLADEGELGMFVVNKDLLRKMNEDRKALLSRNEALARLFSLLEFRQQELRNK